MAVILLPDNKAAFDLYANDIYTNTTALDRTVTYRVQPIVDPDCIGAAVDVVITVHPPILPGQIIGNTSVCYNTDAPIIPNAILLPQEAMVQ